MFGVRLSEVSLDQGIKPKAFVQLAREQQPSIRSYRCSPELDAKLGVEREANRAGFCVTHWLMASAPARRPRNPHFLRALSDCGVVRSPLKTENAG